MAFELETPPNFPETWAILRWLDKLYKFFKNYYVVANVTAAYTVPDHVFYVRADATGGAFAVTIPEASTRIGRRILIKKIDSSGNAVTVTRSGSDTVEGSNTVSLGSQWAKSYLIAGASGSWEKIV